MSVSGHSHQSRRSRNSRNSKMSGRSTLSNLHHQNQILRKDIEDIQNGLISDPFEIIDEGEEREVSTGHTHLGTISEDSAGKIYWQNWSHHPYLLPFKLQSLVIRQNQELKKRKKELLLNQISQEMIFIRLTYSYNIALMGHITHRAYDMAYNF